MAQQAGQRVIYSYPDLDPPPELLRRISAGQAGGVIFFGRNIADEDQIAAVITQLRQARRRSPASGPLLLMTDQEGGPVCRLPGAPAQSEQDLGRSAYPWAATAAAGAAAARELAGVGMNVNLAPVLDVSRGPGDFIAQRSYGADPSADAILGAAFITAQQAAGVAATAKHFPGLGAAAAWQNTDSGPVELRIPLPQLRSTDEVPYRAAIAARVKLIMISWATFPALDGTRPAGLSPAVVQTELRGRLGYTGVTITDALEAGALDGFGSIGQRAVAAATAGADLILCSSGDISQGDAAAAALADAVRLGRLNSGEFDRALARTSALRAALA